MSSVEKDTPTTEEAEDVQSVSLHSLTLQEAQSEQRPFDFTIKCADGEVLAHANVLASASGYFRALLDIDMVETSSRTVELNHMSKATMTLAVDLISGRPVDMTAENALDLLIAARYLQAPELITRCLDTLKTTIDLSNALTMWNAGEEYLIDDLCESAFDFLVKNLTSAMATQPFLDRVGAKLMQALLESDHLVVPNEDAVFDFLTSWLNAKQGEESRMGHADTFKELIRFPFLRIETVARLEETLGPVSGLLRLATEDWDLEAPAFRRRNYTMIHRHFLWQQDEIHPHEYPRLVLTCEIHGHSQEILKHGNRLQERELSRLAVVGHEMYSMEHLALFAIPFPHSGSAAHLDSAPLQPRAIVCDRISRQFPLALRQKYANLHILSVYSNVGILALNTERGSYDLVTGADTKGSATPVKYEQLILDATNGRLIEAATGRWIRLSTPTSAECGVEWVSVTRRDNTVFCWYIDRHSNMGFMSALNLANGEWGQPIELFKNLDGFIQSELIQGDIYMVVVRGRLGDHDGARLDRLDEESMVFRSLKMLRLNQSRCVGMAPADSACCAFDTWLSVEIRKLPDRTPKQLSWIERLRALAG